MENTLINQLSAILKSDQLITSKSQKRFYTQGIRSGGGEALVVVAPYTLLELWRVIEICVRLDVIIWMQAANTGLTGGSTPDGNDYDRPIVMITTKHLKGIHLIDDNRQVIAFPGASLTELEDILRPHQREPHSVIGSSCIGASVIGGICNNSGGSLIRRGPAFTEKSLFAHIDETGQLHLINHLGIDLGNSPEEILNHLDQQSYSFQKNADWEGKIWADDYAQKLRDVDNPSPARFNGDPHYLHESAGCAGKIIVFAARLQTFKSNGEAETFYIGSHGEAELIALKRLLLQNMQELPLQAEYIHKNAFDLTVKYAKYVYHAIAKYGPQSIPKLIEKRAVWEGRISKLKIFPNNTIEICLQMINKLTPAHVSRKLMQYANQFEHHLMIKVEAGQSDEIKTILQTFFQNKQGQFFHCNEQEAKDAFLVRFAVAASTISYCDYYHYQTQERLVSFDIAFCRNDEQWRMTLPNQLLEQIELESCYGHFFCNVMHQDYIVKKGVDVKQFKHEVMQYINQRGGKYPAEHNVGVLYQASEDYVSFFKKLDPTNTCNPGIGKTSKNKFWN